MLNGKLCSQRDNYNKVEHLQWSFFTSVKPYFKSTPNSIELPLGSSFSTTQPFMKKLTTVKTSGEKVFNKEGFLN